MKKAVCLFSGGLDSTTTLYQAVKEDYKVTALTFYYGQKHNRELDCARQIATDLKVTHHVLPIMLPWGGSALLDTKVAVPISPDPVKTDKIPATYVPARNTIFLAFAASCAEATQADAIFIGANALDYSGYPDCRPEYFEAFRTLLEKGTKVGVEGYALEIKTPLLKLSKKEIILLARSLGVPFEKTWSCYLGQDRPCNYCDSCKLRAKGFSEAGLQDPLDNNESYIRR